MHHYTYLLTTEISGQQLFYAGVRSSTIEPELDIYYLGSSRWVNEFRQWGVQFQKQIIETFETREQANEHEQSIFDKFDAVADSNWINLNSHNRPYNTLIYFKKMAHWRELLPQLKSPKLYDRHNIITVKDRSYIVGPTLNMINVSDVSGMGYVRFLGHPDNLMLYYPSTGTRSYSPGRPDRLMTLYRSGEKKYFETDIQIPDDTAFECVRYLLQHLTGRQMIPVLELIRNEMSLLEESQWTEIWPGIQAVRSPNAKDYVNHVIERIQKDRTSKTQRENPKSKDPIHVIRGQERWARRPEETCPICGEKTKILKRHVKSCEKRKIAQEMWGEVKYPNWIKEKLEPLDQQSHK
jgi:hypothetical protein